MTQPFEQDDSWGFIYGIFADEVPEVASGVVELRAVARAPRVRTKVAVYSRDPLVDPVRACLGEHHRNIDAIVNQLHGEPVDLIPWTESSEKLIAMSLTPARVEQVVLDHAKHEAVVTLNRDQLALGIGRRGHNVALASRLTGWALCVDVSEDAA